MSDSSRTETPQNLRWGRGRGRGKRRRARHPQLGKGRRRRGKKWGTPRPRGRTQTLWAPPRASPLQSLPPRLETTMTTRTGTWGWPAVGLGRKKKGKKGKSGGRRPGLNGFANTSPSTGVDDAAVTTAVFFSTPVEMSPPPLASPGLSLQEIRARVVDDVRRRYRYASPSLLGRAGAPVANPHALLRRLCQKLGLRVYARAYDFTGAVSEPLSLADLAEIHPVAKHCAPACLLEEAQELLATAKVLAQTGNVGPAFEYVSEATSMLQQTLGSVHLEVAHCLELSGSLLCQAGDPEAGLAHLEKAMAIYWQTAGFDSFEVTNAHHLLGVFLQQSRQGARYDQAIFHFHACIYLLELVAGPYSPELPTQYLKLAAAYQELGRPKESYQCLSLALEKAEHVPDRVVEAHVAHQLAMLEASYTLYKEALAHEKRSYLLYREALGEEHPRVGESSRWLTELTQKAVERASSKQAQGLKFNPWKGEGPRGLGGRPGKKPAPAPVAVDTPAVEQDDSWLEAMEAEERARSAAAGGKKKKKNSGGDGGKKK
ncbi:eukaryotic translation initiation factor 3 [Nannochloropsis gaditana]|uniref:Eukaryotic translation initiation factor 3 n=1 Tax=Nannochloropsis gaditana TaxID=72520 RepID=W7TF11_9STRA|nr:eukaryotic translation initiation factor 3 [Nannochloropsis gaditana]